MKRILVLGLVLCSLFATFSSAANAQMMKKIEKKEAGSSKKGWLGVSIQDITSEMKKAMDLKSREGALVGEVTEKSPADSAGIQEKDIIIEFAGTAISDASDLQKTVGDTKPGTKVSLVVLRKGEKKTLNVVIGKQKAGKNFVFSTGRPINGFTMFSGTRSTQGMQLRELNDQLAKYFDLSEGAGVLVWEVGKGSAAEKAGINAGDVITMIGRKKIKQLRDVSRALGIFDEGEKAEVELLRKGARKTVTMEVEEGGDEEGSHFWFNEAPFRGHDESMRIAVPEFDVHVPEVEIETGRPELDHMRIEMDKMREQIMNRSMQLRENGVHLKEQGRELREKIENAVRPRVSLRISRSI